MTAITAAMTRKERLPQHHKTMNITAQIHIWI